MGVLGNPAEDILLRELIYGLSGRKKTWWAGAAANAGFNVLVLNGDKPATIYRQLPEAAQSRIRIVNVFNQFHYADLVARFLRGDKIWWDITAGTKAIVGMQKSDHDHFLLDRSKLDKNTVLVTDSWTGLAQSAVQKISEDKKIDLSELEKIEWNLYGPTGMHLTWMLEQFKKLSCHLIVIGHEDVYEKHKKGSDGKPLPDIEFTMVQPVSVSRPHAQLLPKYFTDTLWFHMVGISNYISSESTSERVCGSTTVAPNNYPWEKLQFIDLCKAAGIPLPEGEIPFAACEYIPAGTLNNNQGQQAKPAGNLVLNAVPGKTPSLADLIKRGKS